MMAWAWHTTETVTECRGHLDTIWWFVSKYFDLIIVNIFRNVVLFAVCSVYYLERDM